MNYLDQITTVVTPDIYQRLRQAVELGKWPNGIRLTDQQREICMQAIIRYEHERVEPEARTGYVESKKDTCATDVQEDSEQELRWR